MNRERGTYEVLNMYRGDSPTIASFHIRRDVAQFTPRGLITEIELLNDTSDETRIQTQGRYEDGLPVPIRRSRYILGWDGQLLSHLTHRGGFIENQDLGVCFPGRRVLIESCQGKSLKQSVDPLFPMTQVSFTITWATTDFF